MMGFSQNFTRNILNTSKSIKQQVLMKLNNDCFNIKVICICQSTFANLINVFCKTNQDGRQRIYENQSNIRE